MSQDRPSAADSEPEEVPSRARRRGPTSAPVEATRASAPGLGPDADQERVQRDDSDHPIGELLLDSGPAKVRKVLAPGGGDLASAGLQFAAALLLFTLGGHWLDGRLGTKPWLLLVGLALGLVGGFISLLKQAQAASRG